MARVHVMTVRGVLDGEPFETEYVLKSDYDVVLKALQVYEGPDAPVEWKRKEPKPLRPNSTIDSI